MLHPVQAIAVLIWTHFLGRGMHRPDAHRGKWLPKSIELLYSTSKIDQRLLPLSRISVKEHNKTDFFEGSLSNVQCAFWGVRWMVIIILSRGVLGVKIIICYTTGLLFTLLLLPSSRSLDQNRWSRVWTNILSSSSMEKCPKRKTESEFKIQIVLRSSSREVEWPLMTFLAAGPGLWTCPRLLSKHDHCGQWTLLKY